MALVRPSQEAEPEDSGMGALISGAPNVKMSLPNGFLTFGYMSQLI